MKRSGLKRKKSKHDWPGMIKILKDRTGGYCERCGMWIDIDPSSVHHLLARSKGGDDSAENIVALCSGKDWYGGEDLSCHSRCVNQIAEMKAGKWVL